MKQEGRNKIDNKEYIIVVVVLSLLLVVLWWFGRNHFLDKTIIGDVDCSYLTIEDAMEKIEQEKKESVITLNFARGIDYKANFEEIGIQYDYDKFETIFEGQHNDRKGSREYALKDVVIVNENKVQSFLMQIPELQEENMKEPKNAYIVWDETRFYIEKAVEGSKIDFSEAVKFAVKKLKEVDECIDFESEMKIIPEIVEDDLEPEKDYLNSIVESSITFELSNGEDLTLDFETISTWVSQDENGKYTINTDDGILSFVEELSSKVDEANKSMQFVPAESEQVVTIKVPTDKRAKLDKEQEVSRIKELLGSREPIYEKPIYDQELFSETLSNRLELDITRQHVWFYKDGELLIDTPCVTGNVSYEYDTPTGVYYLLNKDRDVYLKGTNKDGSKYKSFVEYWMRFYKGYGFHDASWRSEFGGKIYKTSGSHGCVNLPESAAKIIYENIDFTVAIIIFKS